VQGAGAELVEELHVPEGSVTFVLVELIARVVAAGLVDPAVSRDFGQYGRGCDGTAPGISLHDRFLEARHACNRKAAVYEDGVRAELQLLKGPPDSQKSRVEDVHAVDLFDAAHADAVINMRRCGDDRVKLLALHRGKGFGIIEARDGLSFFENDAGSGNRAGQRPPAGIVNAADDPVAVAAELLLEAPARAQRLQLEQKPLRLIRRRAARTSAAA
jgi:hypothetical protein